MEAQHAQAHGSGMMCGTVPRDSDGQIPVHPHASREHVIVPSRQELSLPVNVLLADDCVLYIDMVSLSKVSDVGNPEDDPAIET